MKILDATCGARSIWYQKHHPFVVYMDFRKGKFSYSQGKRKNTRNWIVSPDIIADYTSLPFMDNCFDLVLLDPPHLVRKNLPLSWFRTKYGGMTEANYRSNLTKGFRELFRVLRPMGTFILKWSDIDKSTKEILKLVPYKPLFGTKTGQKNNTHWILFIKHRSEDTLEHFP